MHETASIQPKTRIPIIGEKAGVKEAKAGANRMKIGINPGTGGMIDNMDHLTGRDQSNQINIKTMNDIGKERTPHCRHLH